MHEMEYRPLGATGLQVSAVGLGGEHLDGRPYEAVRETVHAALDTGVNIMDVFMPGKEVRSNIGKALRGNREKFIIQGHIGSVDLRQQYDISRDLPTCQRYFQELMQCLETDYIDCGMLFFIDSQKHFDQVFHGELLSWARKLKREGTIRAIGASSHNPLIARQVVESGEVDLLLFSINPAFDMTPAATSVLDHLDGTFQEQPLHPIDPDRMALYQTCQQRQVGITVMKTLGAGKLLHAAHSPFGKPLSVGQCMHYALTRPGVSSVLIGCSSGDEMRAAAAYCGMSAQERDYSGVLAGAVQDFRGSCVYCNHCQPCPAEIDIASVNRYLDIAQLDPQQIPPSVAQHYRALERHGGDCIACGSCEERCPFGVPVADRMAQAARLLGR